MKAKIIDDLETGLTLADVYVLRNVSQSGLRAAKKNDPEFSVRVDAAQISGKKTWLKGVAECERGWQRFAWLLGKKYPDQFGKKVDEQAPVILPVRIVTEEVESARGKSQEAEAERKAE